MKFPDGGGFDPRAGEPAWCIGTPPIGDVMSGYMVVKSFGLCKLMSNSRCSIVEPTSIV